MKKCTRCGRKVFFIDKYGLCDDCHHELYIQQEARKRGEDPEKIAAASLYGSTDRLSYFDGKLHQIVIKELLWLLLCVVTFGIALPWMICAIQRWQTSHTVVEGRRLQFDGTGGQLFGNWLKWWLLTIITLGIYVFWVDIKVRQWVAKHTYFED